jgi:hypothetical protein
MYEGFAARTEVSNRKQLGQQEGRRVIMGKFIARGGARTKLQYKQEKED